MVFGSSMIRHLKVKEVRNWKGKILGLIGKDKPQTLLIRTRFGIHTFGVKFPIDVLVLDDNFKVVGVKKNLLPNRFFFWNPLYDKVLECPKGTIDRIQPLHKIPRQRKFMQSVILP